jgi:glycosyltransferase involved in cell wall biosynthesis
MISVCLVVRNEENLIRRCLESVKNISGEILIAHDGECQDKTIEICREYTNKIFIRDFIGEAETHRCFLFEQAEGDWILQIDADEFLSNELQRNIVNLTKKEQINGYSFLWPIWSGSEYLTKNWPYKLCMFRKKFVSLLALPHFVPEVEGMVEKVELLLEHCPRKYNYTFKIFKNKWFGWAKIQAQSYLSDFSSLKKFNYFKSDWPRIIKTRKKFPLLLVPFEFFATVYKNLVNGAWKEGFVGWKVSFMYGCYRVLLNWNIFLLKKNKL